MKPGRIYKLQFSWGLQHRDTPVLAAQERLTKALRGHWVLSIGLTIHKSQERERERQRERETSELRHDDDDDDDDTKCLAGLDKVFVIIIIDSLHAFLPLQHSLNFHYFIPFYECLFSSNTYRIPSSSSVPN